MNVIPFNAVLKMYQMANKNQHGTIEVMPC